MILTLSFGISLSAFSQTFQTVSATCGSCGKAVSANSKVGDRCPYCGVIWGSENSTTKTTTIPATPNYDLPTYSSTGSGVSLYQLSNTTRNSNLRASPSTNSEILGVLPKNSSILIEEQSGDWFKIQFSGKLIDETSFQTYHGWLHKSNVVYSGESQPSNSNPSPKTEAIKEKEKPKESNATKSETESWILEKLNKYSKEYSWCPDFSDPFALQTKCKTYGSYIFGFEGDYFVIEYTKDKTQKLKTKIPIYDISYLIGSYSKLSISTNSKSMIDITLAANKQEVDSYFILGFDCESETELVTRMETAFLHLKKFYKKPISTEKF